MDNEKRKGSHGGHGGHGVPGGQKTEYRNQKSELRTRKTNGERLTPKLGQTWVLEVGCLFMTFHATKSDRELLCNFTGIVRRSALGVRCLAFAVKMAKVQAIRLEDFASAVKAKRAEESLARGHGGQNILLGQ